MGVVDGFDGPVVNSAAVDERGGFDGGRQVVTV